MKAGTRIPKLRMQWSDDTGSQPRVGEYMMTERGRGGYLVLGINDRGKRGGLGKPTYRLLILTVERVSRQEAIDHDSHIFWWLKRERKRPILPAPVSGGGPCFPA